MLSFKLAQDHRDYAQCLKLMKKVGEKPERLGYPTIVAMDGEKVEGFLATQRRKDALVAGPLIIDRPSIRVALKLLNAYEQTLIHFNQPYYYFTVVPKNPRWLQLVDKFMTRYGGIKKLRTDPDGVVWYLRTLQ